MELELIEDSFCGDFQRLASSLLPGTIDKAKRTIDVRFYSGQPVQRMNCRTGEPYMLSFSLRKEHVRLGRLNSGAPLLNSHGGLCGATLVDQLGVIEKAWVTDDGAMARVRFSDRSDVEPIWQDVANGVIRNVSMGAAIHRLEDITPKPAKEGDKVRQELRAVDWEPMEISAVPIPADPGAQFLAARPGLEELLARLGTDECLDRVVDRFYHRFARTLAQAGRPAEREQRRRYSLADLRRLEAQGGK